MDKKQLQQKLLAAFRAEAAEHLQAMSTGLLDLERDIPAARRGQCVEEMFREAHSLKGAARAVDLADIESVCQVMESLFAAVKRGAQTLSAAHVDALHEAVDLLARLIPRADGSTTRDWTGVQRLVARLQSVGEDDASPPEPYEPRGGEAPAPGPQDAAAVVDVLAPTATVRIATDKLEAMVFRAEEMRAAKLQAAGHAAQLRTVAREAGPLQARLDALATKAERHQRALGAAADGLLDDVKAMLVLPVSSVLELLPKMARDLSRQQGKTVQVQASGTDIEIDRRILQDLREPLVHLVRNAIDHGIEPPELRRGAGKPETGTLTLAFTQQGGSRIEIVVSDDGAGIEAARVRDAAEAAGMRPANDSPSEALQLVFQSGVSTAPEVTELSGRGLGLAIVRDKVERLGGVVSVESQPGRGTAFRMVLPLSLATFRSVQVRVGPHAFFLPTTHVEQALRLKEGAIRRVENRETLVWQGAVVPLVALADVLGLPPQEGAADGEAQAVLLHAAGQRIAFRVDAVLGEQEVMAKPLGPLLARLRHIASVTVLGDGGLAPILHAADLMRSASRGEFTPAPAAPPATTSASRKSVLVAEDSITSRMLLQNILEAAGYRVQTAVDGVDAFTHLKSGRFDAVVSDVEMPRMNGFDLTTRVRADKALAGTPVVLVTALESARDRERGVDAGADAYIVKSSFDQSNLLEVLERLL
jgi:two-component system chemotaxis sensor kinase CheA